MADIQSYRDLFVWQKGMVLVTEIYTVTEKYPSSEQYDLTNQTRRSAVSVPSNIAEGYGRNSTSDYIRFLRIAGGSLYELQTQLEIAMNLRFISPDGFARLYDKSEEIAKMLNVLIKKIELSKK